MWPAAFIIGMNNRFRAFPPGMTVLIMTMEDNRKRGLRAYDPGHENESYKLRMTNNQRELGSTMVYRGTMGVISRFRSFPAVRDLENRFALQDRIVRRL